MITSGLVMSGMVLRALDTAHPAFMRVRHTPHITSPTPAIVC
jgi:hypothetical protein